MLADPRRSRVVLINLTRGEEAKMPAEFAARRDAGLALLSTGLDLFGVPQVVAGEYELNQVSDRIAQSIVPMHVDSLSAWRDPGFTASLAASNVGTIVLAGAWLEEEVCVAALEAVRLGYDVRVLADLSVARVEADRSLVFDRLALHGVLSSTVRQTLLEWAVCLDDPDLKQRVRQLLA